MNIILPPIQFGPIADTHDRFIEPSEIPAFLGFLVGNSYSYDRYSAECVQMSMLQTALNEALTKDPSLLVGLDTSYAGATYWGRSLVFGNAKYSIVMTCDHDLTGMISDAEITDASDCSITFGKNNLVKFSRITRIEVNLSILALDLFPRITVSIRA